MKRLIVLAMAALSVGAVVGSLLLIGGPWEARKQQADRELFRHMHALTHELACADEPAPEALPEIDDPYCGSTFWVETSAYGGDIPVPNYEKLGEFQYRLCGDFHDTSVLDRWEANVSDFEAEAGCFEVSMR